LGGAAGKGTGAGGDGAAVAGCAVFAAFVGGGGGPFGGDAAFAGAAGGLDSGAAGGLDSGAAGGLGGGAAGGVDGGAGGGSTRVGGSGGASAGIGIGSIGVMSMPAHGSTAGISVRSSAGSGRRRDHRDFFGVGGGTAADPLQRSGAFTVDGSAPPWMRVRSGSSAAGSTAPGSWSAIRRSPSLPASRRLPPG
jgi:hypothetical protein